MQPPEKEPGLRDLAEAALRRLIAENKLSPGDLIKLISLELPQDQAAGLDFVVRLTSEEG